MGSSLGTGTRCGKSTTRRPLVAAAGMQPVTSSLIASPALASHPEVSLPGSNFELTSLSVSVDSQVNGGTASTIDCTGPGGGTVARGSTNANGDGSASAFNLRPGTYTCTVVIDP